MQGHIRKIAYAGISAAACIALAMLLLPAPGAQKEDRRVAVSSNYNGGGGISACYKMPDPGEVVITSEVAGALEDAANKDAYFYVSIGILPAEQYTNTLQEYVYNGRSVAEWGILIDVGNGAYPYADYNADHGGNITPQQWEQLVEQAKSLDAQASYDAALARYEGDITPMIEKAKKEKERLELERLKKLGYDVFPTDSWEYRDQDTKEPCTVFSGLLTKAQLLEFDADPECGYFIEWIRNGDGIVNFKG